MPEFISLIVLAALVNNVVFVQLLGVSWLFKGSNQLGPAVELALFTAVVFFLSTLIGGFVTTYILSPIGLSVFNVIVFLVVSAAISTVLATWVKQLYPLSYRRHSLLFPLAGGNSAIAGLALNNASENLTFLNILATSIGGAIGFGLALVGFAAMALRLSTSDIPAAFRGPPALVLSAGIAAMGFIGFAGLV